MTDPERPTESAAASPRHPRTPRTNRLAEESSPYLRQHARNPVDWYAWNDEALQRAVDENKPIFLSIGYSACHWCHVMEHESFEDPQIADYLNQNFVSIKVDREERPDLDAIYMNAVTAMTGHGGWPMSVFLTPDRRPFFGGTYWPPRRRMQMPGFIDILQHVRHAWDERRDEVERAGNDLTKALSSLAEPSGGEQQLTDAMLQGAARQLLRAFDSRHGGFGRAPKFPHAIDLRVLLRVWHRFGTTEARDAALFTLGQMARGGIYDQLGGGFHRYSTDAEWLAPHFEKMLYDQALLIPAYLEAYQVTGRDDFRQVIRETLDYVEREMTSPDGGFHSTQDADSEGQEGKFFVWTESGIQAALGHEDADLFGACYDVTPEGNWEGHTILRRKIPIETIASEYGKSVEEVEEILDRCRKTLFRFRGDRVAPHRDDKILASWNGLMIAAFAQAAAILDEPRYATVAAKAADFALTRLRNAAGELTHQSMHGQAKGTAFLDDYAALADGLTDLYQATGQRRWLEAALELCDQIRQKFAAADSGFYYTPADHEPLIVRARDTQDNATPSGGNLAASALLKLARLTGRTDLEQTAEAALRSVSSQMLQAPLASAQGLLALDLLLGPTYEMVLTGDGNGARSELQRAIFARFVPNKVVLLAPIDSRTDDSRTVGSKTADSEDVPPAVAPLLEGKPRSGPATLYVCQHGSCREPITRSQDAIAFLEATVADRSPRSP